MHDLEVMRTYEMDMSGHQYCVYAHVYRGEHFYIGQGRLGRPFDMSNRNPYWWQYVKEVGRFTIVILGYYPTQTEAKREEDRLLILYQPVCNMDRRKPVLIRDVIPPTAIPGPMSGESPGVRILRLQEEKVVLLTELAEVNESLAVHWDAYLRLSDVCDEYDAEVMRLQAEVARLQRGLFARMKGWLRGKQNCRRVRRRDEGGEEGGHSVSGSLRPHEGRCR